MIKLKIITGKTTLYRKWDKQAKPYKFRKDHVYWFTNKKGLDKIKFPGEVTKSYKFKKRYKLVNLDDLTTLKQIIKDSPPKYKKLIRKLTGYGITKRDNPLCGYKKKLKHVLLWCSVPDKPGAKPSEGIDHEVVRYLIKKYDVNGYYHDEWNTMIRGNIIKAMAEYAILF